MTFSAMDVHKKNGITLTELLVASILVGIVMLGVASFGVSIKQLQGTTNRSTIIAMRTKAAMANITKGAYLAIGNVTDPGVRPDSPGGNVSICFRQDTNNNAQSDSADNWKCYYRDTNEDLWFCEDVPTSNVPVSSQADCNAGTLQQRLLTLTDPNFFGIVNNANRLDYVEITLSTRYDTDPAAGTDPIKNPEYTATTQISPPGHSRW